MGLFDGLLNSVKQDATRAANQAVNGAVNNAVNSAVNGMKGGNAKQTFTFQSIPTTPQQLQTLPEMSMDSPFKTAALALLVLLNYKNDIEGTFAMLDVLKGPEPLNPSEKSFLKDRLNGKEYKPYSFFAGATVQNNYVPTTPYTITVEENPYSYPEENWATMYVQSAGADSPRSIKLRKKPSTGQWFLNDIQVLSDIRTPVAEDPWA